MISFSVQRKVYITYRILAINFRDYKFFRCEFGGLQVLFHFLSQKKSPAKNLVFVQSVSVSQSFFVSVVFFFFEGSRSFDRLIGGTSSLLLQNDMYMYYMATKLLYCCLCTLTAFRLAGLGGDDLLSVKQGEEGLYSPLTFERALEPV